MTATASDANGALIGELFAGYEGAVDKSAYRADAYARHPEIRDELSVVFTTHELCEALRHAPAGQALRLTPGDRVGPFRVERYLDRGGMGEVYEAWHDGLQRSVALKVIRAKLNSPADRERFLAEQVALAKMHSTGIVAIYESAKDGDMDYFAMPLITGVPLSRVVHSAYMRESSAAGGTTPTLAGFVSTLVNVPKSDDAAVVDGRDRRQFQLSAPYFRSVAGVLARAADAVQYAHDRDVLHRDIKPANLMVDLHESCWIIDFGLAGPLADGSAADRAGGTLAYMAPEHLDGQPTTRSDVWSLGATLYELLTLRPAFSGETHDETMRNVRAATPMPPRQLVGNVPADLAAIALKAMSREPAGRYDSPQAFAEDLRRWLASEPTLARPLPWWRRRWLWVRRNRALTAALGLLIVAAGATYMTLAARAAAGERQVQMQGLQQLVLADHTGGWRGTAWEKVGRLAASDRGPEVRDLAASLLSGLDVKREKEFKELGASSVAFDADGQRLLIGGVSALPMHKRPGEGAKVWDFRADKTVARSGREQDGPVAFAGRTPLQLVADPDDRYAVLLWDVEKDALARRFRLPDAPVAKPDNYTQPLLTLAADGATVVAAFPKADETADVCVWDAPSGQLLHQSNGPVTVTALSPERRHLAVGDSTGRVVVRALVTKAVVATLHDARTAVTALAFHRDPWRADGWVLAVGDQSGTVAIWDGTTRTIRSRCPGSNDAVSCLTFNVDGTLLASTTRGPVRLWDVATGRMRLHQNIANEVTGVVFAPDGQSLATSAVMVFGFAGNVAVWRMEFDRGIRTLHGLAAHVEKVTLSDDKEWLAAMSQDFRVGVWKLQTGQLARVFEAPTAAWADNVTIKLNADGSRLAYAGSSERHGRAMVWDVGDGKLVKEWTFAPGDRTHIAFRSNDTLRHFHVETRDGRWYPDGRNDRATNPPVLRARELSPAGVKTLFEIGEFSGYVGLQAISADGGRIGVVGFSGTGELRDRRVVVYDGATGQSVRSLPTERTAARPGVAIILDRRGTTAVVLCHEHPTLNATAYELSGRREVGRTDIFSNVGNAWRPDMPYRADSPYYNRFSFIRPREREPVVTLGPTGPHRAWAGTFDDAGTRFLWGNADGSVAVADLIAVQKRLAELQLGW